MASLLSYALCTVSDVKELLSIDAGDTSKDNLITRKINQATEMIEGYTQRRFASTVYTNEEYHGSGFDQMVLRNRPVISFSNLQVRDTSQNEDDWTTITTDEYWVDNPAGVISAIGSFYGRYNRWRATYTAGYATIPADVAEACATLAAFLTDNPTGSGAAGGIASKREGQREIKYHQPNEKNLGSIIEQLGLDEILDRYREILISGQR